MAYRSDYEMMQDSMLRNRIRNIIEDMMEKDLNYMGSGTRDQWLSCLKKKGRNAKFYYNPRTGYCRKNKMSQKEYNRLRRGPNRGRKRQVRKKKKLSEWNRFVKKYAADHPGEKNLFKKASQAYHRQKSNGGEILMGDYYDAYY